jgi:hypothetical protein
MSNVFAAIQIHHFAAGGVVTGVDPDGVDSGEHWERGRLRKWKDCTAGGLFTFYVGATMHESHSACLRQIAWNLDKLTDITFAWRDPEGIWVPFHTAAADVGLLDLQQVMLFPPAGALQVTATGAAAVNAEIVTWWESGRFDDIFAHVGGLGSFTLP